MVMSKELKTNNKHVHITIAMCEIITIRYIHRV